jgi:hypothetical protein
MVFFKVNNKEYEVYLSSNGVCNIEERTGDSILNLQSKLGFNTIRLLLWACLWEKNKLSVDEIGNLIDEWLRESQDHTFNKLSKIIVDEIKKWTATFNKQQPTIKDENSKKNMI